MFCTVLLLVVGGIASTFATPFDIFSYQEHPSSCIFSGAYGAVSAIAWKNACSTIVLCDIVVPAGITLDLTDLNEGTKVIFQGTTTFGYAEWKGPLVSISGKEITVIGTPGSLIDGDGARWWDTLGGNGGKTKPKFFFAHGLNHSSISHLNMKNSPVHIFSINRSEDLTLDHITVDNTDGDCQGAHNTDAFDVGDSTGIIISNAVVRNQDDCLAVNSGSNITFKHGYCSGGHGLSIGSVGGRKNNIVKDIHILDSIIKDSENGVRIKTVYGANGSVSDITYRDITLGNIEIYGIVFRQDYENGSPTGIPTNGVPITNVTLDNVHGTVASNATNIEILCAAGACSDWKWEDVAVTGGETSSNCTNVPVAAKC